MAATKMSEDQPQRGLRELAAKSHVFADASKSPGRLHGHCLQQSVEPSAQCQTNRLARVGMRASTAEEDRSRHWIELAAAMGLATVSRSRKGSTQIRPKGVRVITSCRASESEGRNTVPGLFAMSRTLFRKDFPFCDEFVLNINPINYCYSSKMVSWLES